tara:strand:- start:1722 stop:1856 length:135 start_codon:yes stop_codon:yes gene_type:complete
MIEKIIKEILKKYPDSNLESDSACDKIAKEIAEAIGDWDINETR